MADRNIKLEQSAASKVPCVKVDDRYLLSNQHSKGLLLLNETGTLIWDLYRQGYALFDIASDFQKKYVIDQDQAVADIERFLEQCRLQSLFRLTTDKQNAKIWGEKIRSGQPDKFNSAMQGIIHTYQICGAEFNIIYSSQSLVDKVHPLFAHLECKSSSSDLWFCLTELENYYSIESDDSDSLVTRVLSLDELIESIQQKITDFGYRGGDWLTVLHASAAGHMGDKAIVFIAPKGSGKSTLTALLQKYGFAFLSDDIVPIADSGDMCPIPLCQRLKGNSWKLIEDHVSGKLSGTYARSQGEDVRYFQPVTGNQEQWQQRWKVAAMVYPSYQESVKTVEIRQLSLIEQLEKICASDSVFGGYLNQFRLQALVDWLQVTPGYELNYSQVDDQLVDLIKKHAS